MSYDPRQVVFCDVETSGLDPERHEVWEVALIVDGAEYVKLLRIDETKADLIALNIGGYHERHPYGRSYTKPASPRPPVAKRDSVARTIANLTHGRHIVGAVPSFDAAFLTPLLAAEGFLPSWHYHLVDVEALMVGHLMGTREARESADDWPVPPVGLPWKSKELSRAVGVDPDQPEFAQHTALGDARWAKACFEAVIGKPEVGT